MMTIRQVLSELGTPAQEAISSELTQMISRGVFTPTKVSDLDPTINILPSKLFIKEKYSPEGVLTKVKANALYYHSIKSSCRGDALHRYL